MIAKERRYTIIGYGQEVLLENSPEGWKDSAVDYQYSETYRTVFRSFQSQALTFYFAGGALLKGWFDQYLTEAEAYLKIEELQDDYTYAQLDYGRFDFSTFEWDVKTESASINIDDYSDIVTFMNRQDMKISMSRTTAIDGQAIANPSVNDVLLKKQDLLRTFSAKLAEDRNYTKGQTTETIEDITDSFTADDQLITVPWGFGLNAFGNGVGIGDYYKGALSEDEQPYIERVELIDDPQTGLPPTPIESYMVRPAIYNQEAACKVAMYFSVIRLEYKLTGIDGSKEYNIKHGIFAESGTTIYNYPTSTITLNHTGNNIVDPADPLYEEGWGSLYLGFNRKPNSREFVPLRGNEGIRLSSAFGFIQDNGTPGDLVIRTRPGNPDNNTDDYFFDVIQSTEESDTTIDESLSPKTDELDSNDFGDDVTIPDQTTAVVLYKHILPYAVVHKIQMDAGKLLMTYDRESIFYEVSVTATGTIIHKDAEGNIYPGHELTVYNTTQDVRGQSPYNFPANVYEINTNTIDVEWEIVQGDTISFDMKVQMDIPKAFILDITIATGTNVGGFIEKSGIHFLFQDSAPADTTVEGYLFSDVLKQCMQGILGSDKLQIAPAVTNNPSALNTLYGTMIMRGSMIRGIGVGRLPMTCSFQEVFESLSRLVCLGLDYNRQTGIFEIDYLSNIYAKTGSGDYVIQKVDNLKLRPATSLMYKGIKVGDETDSRIEGFHADNELHNETEYATRLKDATEYLDLRTKVSTNATEIELTRRYFSLEDQNFTRENDNKLFIVKCVNNGGWESETEQRIYFYNNYENVATTNLAFIPSIVIENNRPLYAMFYNRGNDVLVFNASKYIMDQNIVVDYNTVLYEEQKDIPIYESLQKLLSLFLPLEYDADGIIDANLLEQLQQDRHVVFDLEGIKMYIIEVGADPLQRQGQFKMIACNNDRIR